ncbi:hypothetical protein DPEC_G00358100 [Dallia pectoralis]|uniref:Uncharacterized protein n=1 Tax=Dallia pectoralis TaxID=75939 RepID=A0ACC2F0D7_DALPE|nr:hypothetical protein DPEC_G00358100 [Dallia pectoralis]
MDSTRPLKVSCGIRRQDISRKVLETLAPRQDVAPVKVKINLGTRRINKKRVVDQKHVLLGDCFYLTSVIKRLTKCSGLTSLKTTRRSR